MKIKESAENYLETILLLSNIKSNVRSIDIANELNFSKPSVSIAMKSLKEKEYIIINQNGAITLTPKGLEIAKKIYEKHTLISQCLIKIGVDSKIAAEDACRIEHVISEQTFEKLKEYIKNCQTIKQ